MHRRLKVASVGLAALALTLGGCSSGSSSDGGADLKKNDKYASLAADIDRLSKRPTSINNTEKIDQPLPTGKRIAFIQCGSPACAALGNQLENATKVVGWKLDRINAGVSAETIKAAWGQANESDADAVIASGFSRELFEPELAKIAAKKIPVINLTTADDPVDGITAGYGYGEQWTAEGKTLADYMLVNSGDEPVKLAAVTPSAYANLGLIGKGIKKELESQCDDCTYEALDVPVTSIGSDLPSRVTSFLSANPDVNWLYVGFADMMTGLPAALKAAGLGDVKVVTIDNNETTENYMKNGQSLVMSAGFDTYEMMWRSVDFLIRTWLDMPTEENTKSENLPKFVVTQDNLPSTKGKFPYVEDYQEQYKTLWGVS